MGLGVQGLGFRVWGLGYIPTLSIAVHFLVEPVAYLGHNKGLGHFQVGSYRYRSPIEDLYTL